MGGGRRDIISLQFSVWSGEGISQQMSAPAIYPHVSAGGAIVWDALGSLTPVPLCPVPCRNPISSLLWELAFPESPAGCLLLRHCPLCN